MGFFWREWRRGDHAGVSGYDPDSGVALWAFFGCIIGFVSAFVFGWWMFTFVFVAIGAGVVTGARFRLTIGPNGYRLTRLFFWVVPWYLRNYSRQAVITTEDDWGIDVGLKIHEANENYEQGVVFGTGRGCEMMARRVRVLACEVGCRDQPSKTPAAKPL